MVVRADRKKPWNCIKIDDKQGLAFYGTAL